ncbi:MAG: DUF2064 domain-containing protein [Blastocatellia bacterium]
MNFSTNPNRLVETNATSLTTARCAVLVFADAPTLDLARRRWPQSFQALLQSPQLQAEWGDGADIHLFTTAGLRLPSLLPHITVHAQQGASFAARLENAVEALAQLAYERVVIIGRDCPDLEAQDITTALQSLNEHTLALGPDHHGGCYLIALHLRDRAKLKGIGWQRNTDCTALTKRFGAANTALLPVKLDLDTLSDVRLLARSNSRWRQLAAVLLRTLVAVPLCFLPQPVPAAQHRLRVIWQLPPPAIASLAITT